MHQHRQVPNCLTVQMGINGCMNLQLIYNYKLVQAQYDIPADPLSIPALKNLRVVNYFKNIDSNYAQKTSNGKIACRLQIADAA